MGHKDKEEASDASASSSDSSASASASGSDVKVRKMKTKKSKKGKVKKDKKVKSKKDKKDKKDKKSKSSKRGPRGSQWMTWDIPFQEKSLLGQSFKLASKKGGIKEKELLKLIKKAKSNNPAFIMRLLKRGHNRGWKWEVDDSHDKLRLLSPKLDKKYRKAA